MTSINWRYCLALILIVSYHQTLSMINGGIVAAESTDNSKGGAAVTTTTETNNDILESTSTSSPSFAVKLHLIRHGETESNAKHLVMGQTDSPLTEKGINQAKLANRAIGTYPFWRRYSSDLKRCERTANLILGLEQDSEDDGPSTVPRNDNEGNIHDDSDLILDKRLRERAKGVKEGRPKHLTYDEAFELFRHEHETQTGSNNDHEENAIKVENNVDDNMPLLETEDEVFVRVLDWMQEIVSAAYEDYLNIDIGSSGSSSHNKGRYDIFAVTHSGTLRIIIEKIVGEQLPHDVKREETDKDGVQVGKLIVPNTSITTIDVYPNDAYIADGVDGQRIGLKVKLGSDRNQEVSWKAKLIDLTNTLHLEEKGNENDTNQEL